MSSRMLQGATRTRDVAGGHKKAGPSKIMGRQKSSNVLEHRHTNRVPLQMKLFLWCLFCVVLGQSMMVLF